MAAIQRGFDRVRDVIFTRGGEEHRLGFRAKRLGCTGQNHMPDHFGAGGAARLARFVTAMPSTFSRSASCRAWVDLPVPSPPSKVMNLPRMLDASADQTACYR